MAKFEAVITVVVLGLLCGGITLAEEIREPRVRVERSLVEKIHERLHPTTETPDREPVYKFIHFDARFRGESCRWVLSYAGVAWQDIRNPLALFPTLGAQLPVLEANGKNLTQSSAIARYIAKRHGFAGVDLWEQAQVDALVDYIVIDAIDGFRNYLTAVLTGDKAKAAAAKDAFTNVQAVPVLQNLERQLSGNRNGDGFFFGHNVTFADIIVVNFVDEIVRLKSTVLEPYPKLTGLRQRVHELKGIRQWLARRPETPL